MTRDEHTKRREPLSVDRIVATALALIDEHGLPALSMRRLGTALGFEAMAIYKHVTDKETLLDLVVSTLYDRLELPDADDTWDDRLRSIADGLRSIALAHPHLFVRMITRPPASDSVVRRLDATLHALRDGSGSDVATPESFWLFVNSTSGALLAETAALTNVTPIIDADDMGSASVDCPALATFGPALATCDSAAVYRQTVDMVIEAVARRSDHGV